MWVQLRDEGSRLLYANATIKNRRNTISCLADQSRNLVYEHTAKASLIWDDFKDRMGTSCFESMLFDLDSLFPPSLDLCSLDLPFLQSEIDNVISQLPSDKSPSPDGFNNEFFRKCWPIIKGDFYRLCEAFFSRNLCMQSINISFITLLLEIDGPTRVNDFIPISLLNTSVKLIIKLLSKRLQPEITKIVHKNQYEFIKTRTIQDCLAWAFEYRHLCHASKRRLSF
jgi:hypothetical protein